MSIYLVLTAFFDRLFSRASGRGGSRVLLWGLNSSGKTTLLYQLVSSEVLTTIPTIGFNVETVKLPIEGGKTFEMTAWDIGTLYMFNMTSFMSYVGVYRWRRYEPAPL